MINLKCHVNIVGQLYNKNIISCIILSNVNLPKSNLYIYITSRHFFKPKSKIRRKTIVKHIVLLI
jgi:alanine-alpha-ketoisovalerate/valine-pyruvate aminotransferase